MTGGDGGQRTPHFGLLPSAGMGHLIPFVRLASALLSHGCQVTFITAHPSVTFAEARLIAGLQTTLPHIRLLEFNVPPIDDLSGDPFFLRFEAIRRCPHLLPPLLSPAGITTLVADISLLSEYLPVISAAGIRSLVLFTSSAHMLSLCAHLPAFLDQGGTQPIEGPIPIPGIQTPIPNASIPAALHDPAHIFSAMFVSNGRALLKADGVIVNTFEALEPEAITALKAGHVVSSLPPVLPIGPLPPFLGSVSPLLFSTWLDAQPERSVVYVCFGSRTAMAGAQIRELALGLEMSGQRFLWVVKSEKVDRDEAGRSVAELLGADYMERVSGRGVVINEWVEQEAVLAHPAVGGFLSHCGWNSVTEAAVYGVKILAWPRLGDQRVNAGVVKRTGLGIWVEEWGWEADAGVVPASEIGRRVRELMEDRGLSESAGRVATAAASESAGGSSEEAFTKLIGQFS